MKAKEPMVDTTNAEKVKPKKKRNVIDQRVFDKASQPISGKT